MIFRCRAPCLPGVASLYLTVSRNQPPLGKTFFLQCQRRHPELPKIPTYLPVPEPNPPFGLPFQDCAKYPLHFRAVRVLEVHGVAYLRSE